jgi:hypothetical protein
MFLYSLYIFTLFLVFNESMHVCNLILAHMYSMHSDLPLNLGVTMVKQASSTLIGRIRSFNSSLVHIFPFCKA